MEHSVRTKLNDDVIKKRIKLIFVQYLQHKKDLHINEQSKNAKRELKFPKRFARLKRLLWKWSERALPIVGALLTLT